MTDKRFFPRLIFDIKKNVLRSFYKGKRIIIGNIENISEGGILIQGKVKVNNFDIVPLEVSFNGIITKVNKAQVRWIKKDEHSNKYFYGIEFIEDLNDDFRNHLRNISLKERKGYFIFENIAYLKDINLYGTVYFSRYFEWQGIAREQFFMLLKNYKDVLKSRMNFITKKAWIDYENHIMSFDKILIKVQISNIRKYSHDLIFTFWNKSTKKIVARGGQTITFINQKGTLLEIPSDILNGISFFKL